MKTNTNHAYTIRPVTWTCPVTFRKRKAYRLWIGDKMMAAMSWTTARDARKAASRLAEFFPAPISVIA